MSEKKIVRVRVSRPEAEVSNRTISKTAADLIKARALIEDEGKWCQGKLNDVRNGVPRYCALGAVNSVAECGTPAISAKDALQISALALFPEVSHALVSPAAAVNDTLGHAAILKCFDHAIQAELNKAGKP